MASTPAGLRSAADSLRRSASFVPLAFEEVGPRSDGETWRGPAANVFQGGFLQAEGRVASVAAGLLAVAVRLEARADQLQAEIAAAEREAERTRVERARRREEERARAAAGLPPRPSTGSGWVDVDLPEPAAGTEPPRWHRIGPGG